MFLSKGGVNFYNWGRKNWMGFIMNDRFTNIPDRDVTNKVNEPIRLDPHLFDFDPESSVHFPETGGASRGKMAIAIGAVLLIGTAGFVGIRTLGNKPGMAKDKSADKKLKVTPVLIATAIEKTIPVQIQAIGTVQSGVTVAVTPQASGRVNGVFFKKGQPIKKGQLLFSIDQQSQTAVIQQAQGVVLKGRALVQQAIATRDKDIGAIAQAQATLAKDLQVVEQAKATLDKDIGLITLAQATLAKDRGAVKQARAVLAKDMAQAQFAQAQSQRYGDLFKQGAVSQDQAQQYLANGQVAAANIQADTEAIRNAEAVVQGDLAAIRNAQATVRGDRAAIKNAQAVVQGDRVAIENAKAVVRGDEAAIKNAQAGVGADRGALKNAQVQLAYTKIYSPIDGQAGNILVQMGNVVQSSSNTPLVNIVQVRPIQVSFAVPATNLAEVQKRMSGGKLPVDIKLADTDSKSITGQLSFLNNTVDNTTGTIQLIGDFDNADGKLYPGQYVNATLTLSETPNAIVIPSQAVQNGPDGQFVFVAKPDMTVANVPVTATSTLEGMSAIQKGLKSGDKVVIDGQANLTDGAKIKVAKPRNKDDSSKSGGGKHRGGKPEASATSSDATTPPTDAKTGDIATPPAAKTTGESPTPTTPTETAPSGDKPHRHGGKHRADATPSPEKP
jgi:membrane fusion protein, multidrug efflux system